MRKFLLTAPLSAAALVIAAPASAAITFTLNDVKLSDGGTWTGWFETSDDLATLIDFSITSTTNHSTFMDLVGRTYTKAGATSATWMPLGFSASYASPLAVLQVYFSLPLTASGATLDQTAAETQIIVGGGTRVVLSGTVSSAVTQPLPEPASWALMIGGFALAGAALRRRTAVRFA